MLPPVFSRNDRLQNKYLMKAVWSKMHMESQTVTSKGPQNGK